MDRLTLTPEIYARFAAYHAENLAWGSLHIVLDDLNLETDCVTHCVNYAEEQGDTEGAALGRLLLEMTKTQRGRISKRLG